MLVFKGLDKIEINGLNISKINYDRVESCRNVMMGKEGVTVLKSGRKIGYLKITDNELFTSLVWGVKKVGNSNLEYCLLTLKVSEIGQNNLMPYNVECYRERIERVLEKIEREYGIVMLGDLKVKNVEYNKTVFLERPIEEYEKSLLILEKIAPKRLKSVVYRNKQNVIDTLYVENKSRGYKFYNKGKQLEEKHKIKLDEEVLRIEYSMFTKEQIEKEFGTSDITEWTNEELEKKFIESFEEDFIKPYEKAYEKGIKDMTKLAKEYRKEQRQGWLDKMIIQAEKQGVIFDKEQLYKVVENIDKSNASRLKKRVDKQYGKCNQKEIMQELFDIVRGC